jgi:hypothetical protein
MLTLVHKLLDDCPYWPEKTRTTKVEACNMSEEED